METNDNDPPPTGAIISPTKRKLSHRPAAPRPEKIPRKDVLAKSASIPKTDAPHTEDEDPQRATTFLLQRDSSAMELPKSLRAGFEYLSNPPFGESPSTFATERSTDPIGETGYDPPNPAFSWPFLPDTEKDKAFLECKSAYVVESTSQPEPSFTTAYPIADKGASAAKCKEKAESSGVYCPETSLFASQYIPSTEAELKYKKRPERRTSFSDPPARTPPPPKTPPYPTRADAPPATLPALGPLATYGHATVQYTPKASLPPVGGPDYSSMPKSEWQLWRRCCACKTVYFTGIETEWHCAGCGHSAWGCGGCSWAADFGYAPVYSYGAGDVGKGGRLDAGDTVRKREPPENSS